MTHRENALNAAILQNRVAYSRIAAEWRKRKETDFDHGFHERCRELFINHLKGRRVLDAGCGLGLDSAAFASRGLEVTAADIVPGFLAGIRLMTEEIRTVAMDLTAPCFRDGSFDGIFAFASLLHVPLDLSRPTLSAFEKMLAPGGVIFIGHVSSDKGLRVYSVEDLLIKDNPALCFCHAPEELAGMLTASGYKILALEYYRPSGEPSACAVRHGLKPYQIVAGK